MYKSARTTIVSAEVMRERWHADGITIHPDTLTHDLHDAENAADMPWSQFYDLHHTYATLLLEASTPLLTASARLGMPRSA